MLKINLEYNKGILFVRISGNLNKRTSYKLNNYLVPVIMKHGIKYMVYNLYNLEKIDDFGIKSLIKATNAINSNKGRTYMCEIPSCLKKELKKIKINSTQNELAALELLKI